MKKFTQTALHVTLSDRALKVLNNTSPLDLVEHETDDGYTYDLIGAWERRDIPETEISDYIEGLWDDIMWADPIDAESFGANLPVNWPAIVDWFNSQIDEKMLTREELDDLWEAYWADECQDAPKAIMDAPAVQFEAGTSRHSDAGVNFLKCEAGDMILYAETEVPEGASDDYGYLALKASIEEQAKAAGLDPLRLVFWYDGQEENLEEDAHAACTVRTW